MENKKVMSNLPKKTMKSFKTHLSASHVIKYKEQVKDIVEKVSIKVLKEIIK